MDWMVYGGIGLASEIGRQRQISHANHMNDVRSGIVRALRCDKAFEDELWRLVCDPSKQDEVWNRIETFKRDNPHLCVGRSNWEFVGKNRLITECSGKRTQKIDRVIADNRSMVVSLLCRTHGKLSSIQATELTTHCNYYLCWSALPSKELCLDWNGSSSEVRSRKATLSSIRSKNIDRLPRLVKDATGEQHDAIVYMMGMEFDPSNDDAVAYVVDCIKRQKLNLPLDTRNMAPAPKNGVLYAISSERYKAYLDRGETGNSYIEESIRTREEKERETKSRAYPFGVTYIPDGGELPQVMKEILWANEIIRTPDPTAKDNVKYVADMAAGTYFDGSILGVVYFLLSIIIIISAFSSCADLMLNW